MNKARTAAAPAALSAALAVPAAMVALTALAALAPAALGRDIRVPQDAPTLAAALSLAAPEDRVLLAPGRYREGDLDLPDRVIVEGDLADPGAVVIDGQDGRAVFRAEDLQLVTLRGMTITGGRASGANTYEASGGALLVSRASVHLDRVHFRGNRADASGGAVRVGKGKLTATDCVFTDNHAAKGGGAVDLSYEADASFDRAVFTGNSAAWGGAISARASASCWLRDSRLTDNVTVAPQEMGGAFFSDYAAGVAFLHCVLAGNTARQGGAARLNGVDTSFANCTIDGNSAWDAGGAFMVSGTQLNIFYTIISNNEGAALVGEVGDLQCVGSNIHGNLGGNWTDALASSRDRNGNLESDPLFCGANDHHLQAASPCAPGNNTVGLIGALSTGCDNVGLYLLGFSAARHDRHVDLAWTVSGNGHEFQLQGRTRTDSAGPSWTVPHAADDLPGRYVASDTPPADAGALVYSLSAREPGGDWFLLGEVQVDAAPMLPAAFLVLDSVHPNPFNPRVNILYTILQDAGVRASIHDLQGRLVADLVAGQQPAGPHTLTWDGTDQDGRPLPTGSYLLRLESGGLRRTAKLLMVR
jgi:hypothetical protein